MRHAKKLLFRFLAVALPVAAVFGLVEIGLRLAGRGHALLERDAALGQRYRRGFEGEVYVPEAGRRVALRFNADGFRGPTRPAEAPPGMRRIAVLGDSFIAAVAVAEEATLVGRLEQRLAGRGEGGWEVLNFGVSGFGTGQSLLAWREAAARYRPEIVVAAFAVSNDLADNSRELSSRARPTFELDAGGDLRLQPASSVRAGASRWLSRSRVYEWQKDVLRRARWKLKESAGRSFTGLQIFDTSPDGAAERAWALTEALLRQLHREVSASGAKLLVVIVPDAVQYEPELWQGLVETVGREQAATLDAGHPDRRLGAILGEAGIPSLPLLPVFRAARPEGALNFLDGDSHWNECGNALAAETVQEWLRGAGWLDPDGPGPNPVSPWQGSISQ